jgi:hypothetical protein
MKKNPFPSWFKLWFKPIEFYVFQKQESRKLIHLDLVGIDSFQDNRDDLPRELLRQVYWSFNLAILMMAASSVVSIAGIGLLLSGKVSEAAVTAAGGLTSYIVRADCLRLNEKATDRLNKILRESKQEQ